MANLILQELVPLITAFAILLNSIGGIFGVVVIPYNPDRVEVSLGSNVISDVDEVLEYYNSAVKKTGFVLGTSSYDFSEFTLKESDTDFTSFVQDYIQGLESNSTSVFSVPGEGVLTAADVKSAKMSAEDGKTTVIIKVKDYSHGFYDNSSNNPVTNAFGYSTDVNGFFDSTGMTITDGDMEFTYTDCVISCVIDDKSGKIIYGDWDTTCSTDVENLAISVYDTELIMDFCFKMESHIDI